MNYPDDADGEALRRVAEDGSDMSRPMAIDFAVAAPDQRSAEAIAAGARAGGYQVEVSRDAESGEWSCYCSRTLVPTHEAVVRGQAELDALSRPLGGHADGWGTYGNADEPKEG